MQINMEKSRSESEKVLGNGHILTFFFFNIYNKVYRMVYIMYKLVSENKLKEILHSYQNKNIGMISGCFDVIHFGHTSLFDFSRKNCDLLILGLESDASVRLNKGDKRPIFDQNSRASVLSNIDVIDYILILDHQYLYSNPKINDYFSQIWRDLGVKTIFSRKGGDPSFEKKKQNAEKHNISLVSAPDLNTDVSSSHILEKLGLE